jgi:hypothetical protein
MRFVIGVAVGALGAAVAHHTGQSTTVVYLVGGGLCIAVWCRLFDALWDLGCAALGWDD